MNKFDSIIDDSGKDMEAGPKSPTLKKPPMPTRKQTELAQLDKALVLVDDGTMTFNGFVMTGAGLQAPDEPTETSLLDLLRILIRLQDRAQLYIADALAVGERMKYGEAKKVAEKLGLEPKTISNWVGVARSVELSLREEVLGQYVLDDYEPGISHYNLLQGLKPDQQREYLHAAMKNKMTVRELKAHIEGRSLDSGKRRSDEQRHADNFSDYVSWVKSQNKRARRAEADRLRAALADIESTL